VGPPDSRVIELRSSLLRRMVNLAALSMPKMASQPSQRYRLRETHKGPVVPHKPFAQQLKAIPTNLGLHQINKNLIKMHKKRSKTTRPPKMAMVQPTVSRKAGESVNHPELLLKCQKLPKDTVQRMEC
jgi:hypothetical protein